jgi:hypothetical protein
MYPSGWYNVWFGRDFYQTGTSSDGSVCVDVYSKRASPGDALLVYHSFDDGSASDGSGHGRDGTVYGDVQYTDDGVSGMAAQFDGQSRIVLDSSFNELQWGSAFSVTFWFRRTGGNEFEGQGLLVGGQCWTISSPDATTVAAGVSTEGSPDRHDLFSFVTMYNWQHVAFVYAGQTGQATLYINGVPTISTRDQGSTGRCADQSGITLGFSDGSGLVGDVDELRVYLLALSEDDVNGLYSSPTSAGAIGKGSGQTCAHILALDPESTSGIYRLEPDGTGVEPFSVYCDMEASDGSTDGGWTLLTTRDSGTATEVLTEGSLSPDLRQRAVTALQWQYLRSKSSQLLIKMRGTAAAVDVEGCSDCAYGELTMVMDTSTLASYSCKTITSVLSLAEPLLSRDSNAACDETGTSYTNILGAPEEDVASQNIIHFVGTAATCVETATGDDGVAEDASACTAVNALGSSTACEAVLTKGSDDSQDDSSAAVTDVAACTYTAATTAGVYWSSADSVDQLSSANNILLQYQLVDIYVRGSTAGEIKSCAHVLTNNPEAETGIYTLNPSGMDPFDVHCDMSITDGINVGGWTLVTTRDSGTVTQIADIHHLSPNSRAEAVTAAQWQYLRDEATEVAVVFSSAFGRLTDHILSPHTIDWGNWGANKISDGGQNMYRSAGGNKLSTSLCSPTLLPYGQNFEEVPSTCFGASGKMYMDTSPYKMVLYTINVHTEAISFSVAGLLGAGGSGVKQTYSFTSGGYTGFVTSVCDAGSATVNHLFVMDTALSPGAAHTADQRTGRDDDEVTGIGAGSPFLYILYSSEDGLCMGSDAHQSLFADAVTEMNRLFTTSSTPVSPSFEIDGVCANCQFAESLYIVVPMSKLARFSCRNLKANADLTELLLAHDEVNDCSFQGGDFSAFLGRGTVDKQNLLISDNGGGGETFVDQIFTAKFCDGAFCGDTLGTQDTPVEIDFAYADVYLRSEVETVNFGADVEVEIWVHVQVADWGNEVQWRIDNGRLHGPYEWHEEVWENVRMAPGRHTFHTTDTANDGWHGGYWEIMIGDRVIVGPEEVFGSGGSYEFVLTPPVPCTTPTDDDLKHVAPGICQGTPPGGSCPYSCAAGYSPVFGAPNTIKCESGAWVVATAACGIPCASPTNEDLPHVTDGLCSNTKSGGTCTFSCNDGYYRHASSIPFIYCGLDGTWNSALAECMDQSEDVPLTCVETSGLGSTGLDPSAEDAAACAAVQTATRLLPHLSQNSAACAAVLTKRSDDLQDDTSSAVADAAACTFTAAVADVTLPGSCAHLSAAFPYLPSGHYYIRPSNEIAAFQVYCDMSTLNGGWTLLLTREYGYPTTLAGGVDLSTPRTGLLSTHYQAIKASNFEGACCF